MAAVQAAAAQAARESGGKQGGYDSLPPSLHKAPPPAAREREKLLERLRGVCEGGSVIPVPFLRAAHAVPPAVLDDLRAPYVLHPAHTPALLVSHQQRAAGGTPNLPPSLLATPVTLGLIVAGQASTGLIWLLTLFLKRVTGCYGMYNCSAGGGQ